MRRHLTMLLSAGVTIAPALAGQATGTPTFNAPYRGFTRSEVGLVLSFPGQGGGTAFEGMFRQSSGRFDIGFKGGLLDPGAGDAVLLFGVEARQRVLTHTADFPLDGALIFGAGAQLVSGNSTILIPIGLSLGRRVDPQGSRISIIPYVQPTGILVADGGTDFIFTLGLGADFRLTPRFDARISAGLGDLEGVSLGAVWVH